jgi:hypothetical protein
VIQYTAPRWQILAARMFGEKLVVCDNGFTLTVYAWRGRLYVADFSAGG